MTALLSPDPAHVEVDARLAVLMANGSDVESAVRTMAREGWSVRLMAEALAVTPRQIRAWALR